VKTTGDFGFADAAAEQFACLICMQGGGKGPAKTFAILPGMGKPRANALTQNLALELGVFQFFAIRRLCGVRDYAKPQQKDPLRPLSSLIWCSALSRLEKRGDQRVGCLESPAAQGKWHYGFNRLQLL
jgi:hypothetical protein